MATKRFNYTENDMKNALQAVKDGMSIKGASKLYKVPRTTLLYKHKGITPVERKIGPKSILTKEEEKIVVQWIFHSAECGFPTTKTQLLDSIQMLVKNLKRDTPFTNGRPGRQWYKAFMRRHPELSLRVSQNLTNSRASVTEENIRKWFNEISNFFKDHDYLQVFNDPRRVYNCDETAFFLSPKEDKVIVKKGQKAVYNFINNDEKECLTTLVMCNAFGDLPPPMIVFSYKRVPQKVVEKIPPSWGVGRTDSGWMTCESFYEYVTNIFNPWLLQNSIPKPVVLFVDGHTSHMSLTLSEFCSKNGIILIALHPNSTHFLQPLDVAFFHPLKNEWKKAVHNWRVEHDGMRLSRDEFAPILKTALANMKNIKSTCENGFRTCGLFPFNPDNINYKKFCIDSKEKVADLEHHSIESYYPNKSNLEQFLKYFSQEMPDKINLFEISGDIWTGDLEDQNLFYFWLNLKNKVYGQMRTDVQVSDDNTLYIPLNEEEFALFNDEVCSNFHNENDVPLLITVPPSPNENAMLPLSTENTFVANETNHENSQPEINNEYPHEISNDNGNGIEDHENVPDNDNVVPANCDENSVIPVNCDKDLEISNLEESFQNNISNKLRNCETEKVIDKTVIHDIDPKEDCNEKLSDLNLAQKSNESDDTSKNHCDTAHQNKEVEDQILCQNKTPPRTPPQTPPRTLPATPAAITNTSSDVISHLKAKNPTPANVPTPFKTSLFWPDHSKSKVDKVKRRIKEKIPSVVSSAAWQSYYKKKEEKKKKKKQKS